ncbi:GPI mannosyltransferase 2 [Trametes polyzona]|nr:GPI mannosyltransferase 2 [Trametes polyzona]
MSPSANIPKSVATPARNDRRILLALSCTATLLTLLLTLASSQLPRFDASPLLLIDPQPTGRTFRSTIASAVLRWDTFHFGHTAKEGYVYEHEWAFFPGISWAMRTWPALERLLGLRPADAPLEWEDVLFGGFLASSVVSVFSVLALYDLTVLHFRSREIAWLACLLSLLPSSPVTLRIAGYTEAFFTFLSYRGMLCCARKQWFWAACYFALATVFRSNGITLSGFIAWGLVIEPLLQSRKFHIGRALYALVLCALTVSPFVLYQYYAYRLFCAGHTTPAPWCSAFPPSIYTYVQGKYWNVGFLRYWTPQQIPNFLLGAPPLALLLTFTTRYIRLAFLPRLRAALLPSSRLDKRTAAAPEGSFASPFLTPSIAPHALHALALSLVLLFASHTQIVLRLAASMPLTYWAAAWLLVERPRAGRWWVGWSVVWGAVSCVLWAVFLPPA